jgi:hypothetical protein
MLAAELDLDSIQQQGLPNFKGGKNLGEFFSNSNIISYIFYASGIALLIYLILGGFQLMFSRGDPKAVEGAKGKITNALIGFVIVIFAYFLTQVLGKIFGIGIFKDIFG